MKKIFVVSMVFALCAPGASAFASKDFGFSFSPQSYYGFENQRTGLTLSASYLFLGSDTAPLRAGLGLSQAILLIVESDVLFDARTPFAVYATTQFYPWRSRDTRVKRFYLKGNAGLYTDIEGPADGWNPYYALGIGLDFGKRAFWECVFSGYACKRWGSWNRYWTFSTLTFGFRL